MLVRIVHYVLLPEAGSEPAARSAGNVSGRRCRKAAGAAEGLFTACGVSLSDLQRRFLAFRDQRSVFAAFHALLPVRSGFPHKLRLLEEIDRCYRQHFRCIDDALFAHGRADAGMGAFNVRCEL